ncbi:hypothetical protein ACLVXC_004178 [Vibrio alginolyticus]
MSLSTKGHSIWLFSSTANGAETSAMLYSIVETAKTEPDIDAILPWNYKH